MVNLPTVARQSFESVGGMKILIANNQFFCFGHNIASDCSLTPWELKTVNSSKMRGVTVVQGGKKRQITHKSRY